MVSTQLKGAASCMVVAVPMPCRAAAPSSTVNEMYMYMYYDELYLYKESNSNSTFTTGRKRAWVQRHGSRDHFRYRPQKTHKGLLEVARAGSTITGFVDLLQELSRKNPRILQFPQKVRGVS